jgi:hypothetical protein
VPKWPQIDQNSLKNFFGEIVQNNQKTSFLCCFYFWGAHLGSPKLAQKGPQMGGLNGAMSKLKNELLAKSLGPFF